MLGNGQQQRLRMAKLDAVMPALHLVRGPTNLDRFNWNKFEEEDGNAVHRTAEQPIASVSAKRLRLVLRSLHVTRPP